MAKVGHWQGGLSRSQMIPDNEMALESFKQRGDVSELHFGNITPVVMFTPYLGEEMSWERTVEARNCDRVRLR